MRRPHPIERLARVQAERAAAGTLRRVRAVQAAEGAWLQIDGRRLLGFASNDYLGLAQHPRLREALWRAASRWGVGATAAHLLGGHRGEHEALEQDLARWTGRDRALLFSTGYMANIGVLAALLDEGDSAVQDKLNHASLIDGARLAGACLRRYVHGDVDSARRQLAADPSKAAVLSTDGVFSMDGDIAPLGALARLCREEGAVLHVDDAHGLGVVGPEGAGCVAQAGLSAGDVPVLMGTLGKALGVAGAFVAGDATMIDGLVQRARSYVYTTAMPPALAAAARVAVEIARFESWRRERLAHLVAHFRHGAAARGLELVPSTTPIQPVLAGSAETAVALSRGLLELGFYVPAIRPPTVPSGKSRLRVTFSVHHGEADVEALLDAISHVRQRLS
ncbi:8-amino-7-oxononanoate synthase [Tahibacter amnicola]|uniref:8-amino-7-oxononanoate synthase n=1 Tax=Tahibacter amnicola TaxID=2976241 RepID=A0ABY6BDQ8_9GAMM|nr:8-amino-7-oxononanoate synthase [Tahibacter amnicola]UXI68168.1 8-amino-7-oxononanoate synthase [Tahibacter amnicola]